MKKKLNILSPEKIKEELDRYVIGQDEAKKTLAVAVYNHYKRLNNKAMYGKVEIDKSNVILLGETGCGKTLMVKTIAKLLNVPCYIQDCTKITASGYVGSDVEDCLAGLLRTTNYDIHAAEMGIVMLDEGDKIAKKEAGPSITRDVSGECVQQSLLKIVEGDKVGVQPNGGRKHPEQPLLYVDTTNILFILSGAFVGLEDIVSRRLGTDYGKIGFNGTEAVDSPKSILSKVTSVDIQKFGFIPEFVGRFPVITNVEPLDKSAMERILVEPQNSLVSQYVALLKQDKVALNFEPAAISAIAEYALDSRMGARGLRYVMEKVMRDIMYEVPSLPPSGNILCKKRVKITESMVRGVV